MNMHRLQKVLIAAVVSVGSLMGAASATQADDTLNAILKVGEVKNVAAKQSQVKIEKLADEPRDLLQD